MEWNEIKVMSFILEWNRMEVLLFEFQTLILNTRVIYSTNKNELGVHKKNLTHHTYKFIPIMCVFIYNIDLTDPTALLKPHLINLITNPIKGRCSEGFKEIAHCGLVAKLAQNCTVPHLVH